MQRALLQYFQPKNQDLVRKALRKAKRFDLIGHGKNALVEGKPAAPQGKYTGTGWKKGNKSRKGKDKSWQKDVTKKGKGNRKRP